MKKFNLIAGIFFVALGLVLMLHSPLGMTGYSISESASEGKIYFSGIFIAIVGLLVLMSGKERNRQSGLEIMISRKALERAKKDNTIRANINKYANEIEQIAKHPQYREKVHKVGEFNVSPRGHRWERIAWHYDESANRLYIDDVLYKTKQKKYVDDWANRAGKGNIILRDYSREGYVRYKTPEQIKSLREKRKRAVA